MQIGGERWKKNEKLGNKKEKVNLNVKINAKWTEIKAPWGVSGRRKKKIFEEESKGHLVCGWNLDLPINL